MKEDEELYYPCSENKGADQLCSYHTADRRLCFRLCKFLVFSCGGSFKGREHLVIGITENKHALILTKIE